jgi:hypothetical protein
LTTTPALPFWDELSPQDQGAVLLHLARCEARGPDVAAEQQPPFFTHPALSSLSPGDASKFARLHQQLADMMPNAEWEPLYDEARLADQERRRKEQGDG